MPALSSRTPGPCNQQYSTRLVNVVPASLRNRSCAKAMPSSMMPMTTRGAADALIIACVVARRRGAAFDTAAKAFSPWAPSGRPSDTLRSEDLTPGKAMAVRIVAFAIVAAQTVESPVRPGSSRRART